MVLTRNTTRTFHRRLYAGELVSVTLLKRSDDQREGTVTPYVLFQVRKSAIRKHGEPIAGEMSANMSTTWHIPRVELDRVGVHEINAADRIVDGQGRTWQPESNTQITSKLFENHTCVDCLRVGPGLPSV